MMSKPAIRMYGGGSGDKNLEFPVHVGLKLRLSDGSEARLRYSYNYRGGEDIYEDDFIQIAFPDVEQDVWLRDESFRIREHFPSATELTEVKLSGKGWSYEGYVDNLAIK